MKQLSSVQKSSQNSVEQTSFLQTNSNLIHASFKCLGTLEDAKALTLHLQDCLKAAEPFCLLLDGPLGTMLWKDDANDYFNDWCLERKESLACCQTIAFVANLPKRKRLLAEFVLSKQYGIPHKFFKDSARALAWVKMYAGS